MKKTAVKVRFAPSPTGHLHVGGARTALYNYLLAKKMGGTFVYRVEDTDLERSSEESMRMQISDLDWLGLSWDEGLNPTDLSDQGDFGPYKQSQRTVIYKEYAGKLLKEGKAYYCFLTDEEIEKQREEAKVKGLPPHVNSPYKNMSLEDALNKIENEGKTPVVRFKTPESKQDYVLNDIVRGEVVFPSTMVGDFVLIRSNGMPVYNFCCVIDDALMKITHVLRAEEHLSNTLRQMMIYQALGFELPQFGHLSIILGSDKQKLSKRHGATSISQYKELGYLPEAMNNFLALMGWSSPKGEEIMSLNSMIEQFSTDRFNPAPAVFDEVKLKWMNATHLRSLPLDDLWNRIEPLLSAQGFILPEDKNWRHKALEVFKTSMELLNDSIELFRPLSKTDLVLDEKAKDVLTWEKTNIVLETWIELLKTKGDIISSDLFIEMQDQVKEKCEVKGKFLFMPIRVAVIGKAQGAELKNLVPLLDKNELIKRAEFVKKHI